MIVVLIVYNMYILYTGCFWVSHTKIENDIKLLINID